MVSLRRRRLLGLPPGPNSAHPPLPLYIGNGRAPETPAMDTKTVIKHPLELLDIKQPIADRIAEVNIGSSNISASGSLNEWPSQQFPEIRRRKQHRRKNLEPYGMRGVYFKNMKWQAAIKVEKKQIHLGTVPSKDEAAHLYDRAAFMCGREPNFELSDEEKKELSQYNWHEFLAMTRNSITNKKHKREAGIGTRMKPELLQPNNDWNDEQGTVSFSASEEIEAETLAS